MHILIISFSPLSNAKKNCLSSLPYPAMIFMCKPALIIHWVWFHCVKYWAQKYMVQSLSPFPMCRHLRHLSSPGFENLQPVSYHQGLVRYGLSYCTMYELQPVPDTEGPGQLIIPMDSPVDNAEHRNAPRARTWTRGKRKSLRWLGVADDLYPKVFSNLFILAYLFLF